MLSVCNTWKKTSKTYSTPLLRKNLDLPEIAERGKSMQAGAILHNILIKRGNQLLLGKLTDIPIETSTLQPQNDASVFEDNYTVAAARGIVVKNEIIATLTMSNRWMIFFAYLCCNVSHIIIVCVTAS